MSALHPPIQQSISPHLSVVHVAAQVAPFSTKNKVIEIVSNFYNMHFDVLNAPTRKREVVFPRQMCMTLLARYAKMSLDSIGELFNGKDHTTVIHARNTVKDLVDCDLLIREQFNHLCRQIEVFSKEIMQEHRDDASKEKYIPKNSHTSWYLETIPKTPPNMSKAILSEKDIAAIIGRQIVLTRHNPVCIGMKNLYADWEQDIVSMNENDYITEFEIKVSHADFKRDALKRRKHDTYKDRVPGKCPNYFYFVCPDGLIQLDELPSFAGLAYITDGEYVIIKKAPKLHTVKMNRDFFTRKVSRIYSERQFLGCSLMTFKNRMIMERNHKIKSQPQR